MRWSRSCRARSEPSCGPRIRTAPATRRAARPAARPRHPGTSPASGSSGRAARPGADRPGYGRRPRRLPKRDLTGRRGGDHTAPAGGTLARLQQHGGAELGGSLGDLLDPFDLDVRQPECSPRSALDDAPVEVATELESEIRVAAGVDSLWAPAQELRVEGACGRPVARVQLEVNHRVGPRGAHASPSNSLKEPIGWRSATRGAASQRSPISFWNSRNAGRSDRGLRPSSVSIEARWTKFTPSSSRNVA